MAESPTLRDSIVARLKTEFGDPWQIGQNFRWSIHLVSGQAPLNIAVDCWRTPERVKVWIFDPRRAGPHGGITWFSLEDRAQIDPMVDWLRDCVNPPDPE